VSKESILKYIETTLATGPFPKTPWFWKVIMKILLFIFPKANPDFEHLYDSVDRWWIELNENDVPQKEIGFDNEGNIIVAGPIGKNYGFWTDSTEPVIDSELSLIDKSEFLKAWETIKLKYEN
jgi:hypothetical protein